MGITGLLPFLEKGKVSKPANIKTFSGCTVAADAYCWLHKGAFACADKLARGEETDMYVQYCMKYVNLLLSCDIKPILVFDGRHLPAKAQTEKKRRVKREENRKQAASLLRQGQGAEALSFLRRCVDVTHKMALSLMKECRRRNIDCIVAPYEADAQLAFFSLEGVADLIVTEDSDLLLFGCKRVMFKMDLAGNGVVVEQDRLYQAMGVRPELYSFDKFRYMCILSGCDYLDSLPGIGLGKACKFITRSTDPDIHKALARLPSQLNIRGLSVPPEYRDDFVRANAMFKHQLVFDPSCRKTRPLTPHENQHPASPLASGPLPGCEPEFDDETSYQLALGNLDPFKLEKVDDYDPDGPKSENPGVKTSSWKQTAVAPHPSIWNSNFSEQISKRKPRAVPSFMPTEPRLTTKGKVKSIDIDTAKLGLKDRKKRALEDEEREESDSKRASRDTSKLTAMYTTSPLQKTLETNISSLSSTPVSSAEVFSPTSPILSTKRSSRNPFARSPSSNSPAITVDEVAEPAPPSGSKICTTPTAQPQRKFGALNKFARAIQRTSTEGKPFVQSRYFNSNDTKAASSPEKALVSPLESSSNLLRDVSNTIQEVDHEREQSMLQGYTENTAKMVDSSVLDRKSPMVRRKPLFASLSGSQVITDTKESENNAALASTSTTSIQTTMQAKFSHKMNGLKLAKSPSKNPFRIPCVDQALEQTGTCQQEECGFGEKEPTVEPLSVTQEILREEEDDVDDPGFSSGNSQLTAQQFSTDSLNPSSPTPDEGFGSPSRTHSKTVTSPPVSGGNSGQRLVTPRRSACRMQGLKKPPPPNQSKLSAFGFMPKPKLQKL